MCIYIKGYPIISQETLGKQFKHFYTQQKPKSMQDAFEKFALFGGVNWGSIETSTPAFELIQKLILQDYRFIRNDVTQLTTGAPLHHSILTAIAQGDGKTHSIYKRAKIASDIGSRVVKELCQSGIIYEEKSPKHFTSWSEHESIDKRLFFSTPFLHFWFAYVSPLFQGIKEGNYKEVQKLYENTQADFLQKIFIQLSHELLKSSFKKDKIVEISHYWDRNTSFDIYAKTASGKIIVGSAKYTNAKVKRSELTKLQAYAKNAGLEVATYVIFSKNGFTKELKSLKGDSLKLFALKNFTSIHTSNTL